MESHCAEIPRCVGAEGFHVTLIYSRTALHEFAPIGRLEEPLVAKPRRFVTVATRPRQLLLEIECAAVVARHREIMDRHPEARNHLGDFLPHITLSYDIGPTFDAETLDWFPDECRIPLTIEFSHELIPAGAPRRKLRNDAPRPEEDPQNPEGTAPEEAGRPRRRRAHKKKR